MTYNLPPPGSPEDARQLRQMMERMLTDVDRLWQRVSQSQQDWSGMPAPSKEVTFEIPTTTSAPTTTAAPTTTP